MTPKIIPFAQLKYHWTIYFFAIPSLALVGLFMFYPAMLSAFHSVYRWNGADINEFVGKENFTTLLGDAEFWRSFRVSFIIGVWNIFKMVPAVAVAVCIHRCKSTRAQFFYRILFVAPMVIPPLIVMLIWKSFFFEATNGYLNRFLFSTGFFDVLVWFDQTFQLGGIFKAGSKPAWMGDGRLILFACIFWGLPWVGSFAVLTHLAKLGGIPRELYEAADLDGANWWTRFTKLELPLMMGSINLLLVLVVIDTIKDAGMVLALAGIEGGPGGVVTVPALFMLRKAFIEQQMGAACAVGIVLTAVVMTLKKILDGTADWQLLNRREKSRYRVMGMVMALLLYAFMLYSDGQRPKFAVLNAHDRAWFFLFNAILPGLVMVFLFPWGWVRERIWGPMVATTTGVDAWRVTLRQVAAREAHLARMGSAFYHWRERVKGLGLTFSRHGFVLAILAFAYLPMYLMVIVSFKNNAEFYAHPATLTFPLHWENWAQAWDAVIPSLANSVFTTTASTALTLFLALAGAYFFARVRMPGSSFLWYCILFLMMMPTIANAIPLYRLLIDMNLSNTLSALIFIGAASGQMFALFVLRNFVADLPQDLFEAADIDGASHLRQMLTIVAPLSGPILGVLGLIHAVGQWNEWIMPLIVIRDAERLPVTVQLLRMSGEYIKLWGPLMAGYAMASIPIILLFILCMRLFVRNLTEGAVKG